MKDVIVVPRDAVVEGTVFVAVPSTDTTSIENSSPSAQQTVVQRRTVELGRTLQSLVVIESGLQPGDRVVMTNLDVIYDGAQLKIDPDTGVRHLSDELARLRTPQVRIVDQD